MSRRDWNIETKCIQEGWIPGNGQPRVLPIVQSTTFKYDSAETLGRLFDLEINGDFYTRLSNPTNGAVEAKIAALEGGVGALLTSSGQAASLIAVLNIARNNDHIISAGSIYGGTFNLFEKTLREMGIDVDFVDVDATEQQLDAVFKPNTKLIFGETLSNPGLCVLDIEKFARVAHKHGVPLIVDNTFPTPVNCRPIEFGADIVTHSTSKYLDGHATVLGGVIVDSGRFDWMSSDKYPGLTTPDITYHGIVYTEKFGNAAYIAKCRAHLMRDLGAAMSPLSAFLRDPAPAHGAPLRERHEGRHLVGEQRQGRLGQLPRAGQLAVQGDRRPGAHRQGLQRSDLLRNQERSRRWQEVHRVSEPVQPPGEYR